MFLFCFSSVEIEEVSLKKLKSLYIYIYYLFQHDHIKIIDLLLDFTPSTC
jgi:hypothetical protein